MVIFKRLLAAAIAGAAGFFGIGALLKNPAIAIGVGVVGIITGWCIPSAASEKIVSETGKSLSGPKRNPIVTLFLWLVMFVILALGLVALGMFVKQR